jgi:ribosomal protein L29
MPKTSKNEMKDIASLAALDRADLVAELTLARKQLYLLKMKKAANELKQSHQITLYRTYVAQIQTMLQKAA